MDGLDIFAILRVYNKNKEAWDSYLYFAIVSCYF